MDWADLLASNLKACDIISVRDMERVSKQAREHLTLWLNSGSVLEGRPVSPASKVPAATPVHLEATATFVSPPTGEREAELRELVTHTTAAHENLFDVVIPHSSELDAALCSVLTPLLDRREAEYNRGTLFMMKQTEEFLKLQSEHLTLRTLVAKQKEALQMLLDNQNGCPLPTWQKEWDEAIRLSGIALALIPEGIAAELAARDARIKELETLAVVRWNTIEGEERRIAAKDVEIAAAHTHMDKLREHRNDLDAACHELEGKLRESEAARGEAEKDRARIESLAMHWNSQGRGHHLMGAWIPNRTGSFRDAVDAWSAARAQEAKP